MADQLLSAIIELENQIEQQLQQEQAMADAWLAGVCSDLEAASSRARQNLRKKNQNRLAIAKQQAEQRAAALLEAEMAFCTRLEEISEEALLEVLRRQLVRILPRQVDDHQDGQN